MTIPTFTMRQLLEAEFTLVIIHEDGIRRWKSIFWRNKILIIDLEKTVPMLYTALETIHEIAKKWKNTICWN